MAVVMRPAEELSPIPVAVPRVGLGRLRKIGLVGSHAASLAHTPWDDPTWELWAHAAARGHYRREPDRYFDLHRHECWSKSNNKGASYVRWLGVNTVPIYMQQRRPDVPASITYPLERVRAEFRPYFTNHVAYMIALALMEGVTHLGFFGVNYGFVLDQPKGTYNADLEFGTQRGSCEYWMGQAEGRGVQLVIPKGCNLLQDPKELYGYESHDAEGVLVESYRRRTWIKPAKDAPPADPVGPDGMDLPPAHLAAQIAQEALDHPSPLRLAGVGA